MGSFLGKGFDFGWTIKKRMVSSEPMFFCMRDKELVDHILLHFT